MLSVRRIGEQRAISVSNDLWAELIKRVSHRRFTVDLWR
jgi:hypothetical protein